MRAYAIGDIHGHLDLLKAAQALVAEDRARIGDEAAPLIHLGDLVDRGPASRGVIEHLMAGQQRGENWRVVKGNHDQLFQLFLDDPDFAHPRMSAGMTWLNPRVGGAATLASYGIDDIDPMRLRSLHTRATEAVPAAHRQWIAALPTHLLLGEVLFVHAGIRPGLDLRQQSEGDMLWIRNDFLDDPRDHGVLVVHGHTAIPQATHYGNRLNMDSDAARGGPVSAAVIEGRDAWLLTPAGRVRL